MAKGKEITKSQFHKIMRAIKDKTAIASIQQIADKHRVSPESVRAIRRAKTWPGFLANKEAKRTNDAAKRKQAVKGPAVTKSADDQLQQKLDIAPDLPLTPEYVQELLDGQQEVYLSNQNIVDRLDKLTRLLTRVLTITERLLSRRWWKRG